MTSAPQDIPGASTTTSTSTTTRNRANTFSYPRWDANGNSHHPPPDVGLSRTLSRSTNASNNATSPSPSSPPPLSGGTTPTSSSSILRLLGLASPPPSSSKLPSNTAGDEAAGDSNGPRRAGAAGVHRRGVSYGGTSTSSYSMSNSSPFYEDDEDGPPEAVTPPQHHDAPSSTGAGRPTNYGQELDAAHKLEIDHEHDDGDAFDGDSSFTLSNNRALAGSEPLGRRASWSPAVKRGGGAAVTKDAYSCSPPAGVMSWLHGQQSTYPISVPQNQQQQATKQVVPPTSNDNNKDYGASPVGLFRRLSLSVNRRPPPPAPASTISEVSDMNDKERIGRPLTKVTSAPPRRLSPMGERMLRAHYDSFS